MPNASLVPNLWELTNYIGPVIAFVACMLLFARTRKVGFRILGVASLFYLLPRILQHVMHPSNPWFFLLLWFVINLAVMAGWVVLAAEFLADRGLSARSPAVASAVAPAAAPTCARCNTPLAAAASFCTKCGQPTTA
ncbi:MAG TPA: hypothetical protein VFL63_13175 [Rhodanobacteraceae bacterium]|jgi:hypothetical protein|nr:hypothetical protein [Rhodanobacteraceae bacterium]